MLSPRSLRRNQDTLSFRKSFNPNSAFPTARGSPEYPHLKCAFHPQQKITNFCKNYECLLPMCPRCVKIHTEEHMRHGTHGQFEIISDCFKELEEHLTHVALNCGEIAELARKITDSKKDKNEIVRAQFQETKRVFLEQLQRIFIELEKQLEDILRQQEIGFAQEVLGVQDSLCYLVNNSKKGTQAIYSSYALEFLIQHHSQPGGHDNEVLNQCRQSLQALEIGVPQFKPSETKLVELRSFLSAYMGLDSVKIQRVTPAMNGNLSGSDIDKLILSRERNRTENPRESQSREVRMYSEIPQSSNPFEINLVSAEAQRHKKQHYNQPSTTNMQQNYYGVAGPLVAGSLSNRLGSSGIARDIETPLDAFDLTLSRGQQLNIQQQKSERVMGSGYQKNIPVSDSRNYM